ncbi:hypothetical protein I6A60_32210 [Frankia sp. AgB1.9]|uniref:argonaute/piwi family protein n=1 Tax=unclassified Frankia TaxID=2632575 RepID=UPI001932F7AC|nr:MULTISPECIES: hypothetical protein [unclassified Frankia]MBL7491516.1 hypothetical protein [Frankia sp. AgW1.1]MBL7552489.1 hypothetical protein [Frankia sp. AgB1.9]MBL7622104.1 hypothetical protein [Frankia sp. AgB1.8]
MTIARPGPPRTSATRPLLIDTDYLPEPLLLFADDGLHVDPKSGIARYGPRSLTSTGRHPGRLRIGIIGRAQQISTARRWLESQAAGVNGDPKNPEFPGWMPDRGFFSQLEFADPWNQELGQSELRKILEIESPRERFETLLRLLEDKLQLLAERDSPPEYILIAISDEIVTKCGTADYTNAETGTVHRDLRRALKAIAMKYRIPTQILREATMDGRDRTPASRIAWNFFTAMYCKAGGYPWSPHGLAAGTCYVGIGFYRPLGARGSTMQTSLIQAFDEHGEGLVLRGHDFDWDPDKTGSRSPHLTADDANALVTRVLDQYERQMHQTPSRIVVHKTSRYWPDEREGFHAAIESRVRRYDLMALEAQSAVRLITMSKYPPLRGTRFTIGDLDYLYTTGYLAALGEFHGMHVPAPLQVADHIGQDTPREVLLREVLALTKLNWNSAALGGLLPITIKFSRLVGEIMREIPDDREPLPQFKFYI